MKATSHSPRSILPLALALVGALAGLAITGLLIVLLHQPAVTRGGPVPAPRTHRFEVGLAWRLVREQVAVGPRTAGSPALRRLADRLVRLLPHGHFEPIPGEPGLRNIVGTLPGRGNALLIGAHYDTLASPPGDVGANNGAAGTAIVIAAAHALARLHRPADAPELRFVLFDGEEPAHGLPEDTGDFYDTGLRGSRADAAREAGHTAAMVLLDYVGNRGLRLPREGHSDEALWAQVRRAAQSVGVGAVFPAGTETGIIDDHTPYQRQGVPAVDLIDWRYPGHSATDRLDKLSRRSIAAVGETIVAMAADYRPR